MIMIETILKSKKTGKKYRIEKISFEKGFMQARNIEEPKERHQFVITFEEKEIEKSKSIWNKKN